MTDPVKTKEKFPWVYTPTRPHCGGAMDDAAVSLSRIIDVAAKHQLGAWIIRIDSHVTVDDGGYAAVGSGTIVAECPSCRRPSVLLMNGLEGSLVAARTEIDQKFFALFEEGASCPEA